VRHGKGAVIEFFVAFGSAMEGDEFTPVSLAADVLRDPLGCPSRVSAFRIRLGGPGLVPGITLREPRRP
jgi:hypothetical protein